MSAPNGIPAWLTDLGLKNGDYYIDSKLRAKRAMKSACFSPPARIHICLGLATMGFQQELAVRLEGNKRVPIQPADVCQMTGLDRRHFREYMNSLEAMGLAAIEGWTKGRVKLYSWAVPRDVDPKKIVPRAGTIFEGFPPDLIPLLQHYRIRFPPGFVPAPGTMIEELERRARATKDAELSLRAYAKSLCAGDALQRNGKEPSERNVLDAAAPSAPPSPPAVPLSKSNPSSVGRSSSPAPTDRPIEDSGNPFKTQIREWLESHAAIPGFPLEEPELEQIAATIHSENHLEQFKKAALRQKNPRGWIVFVKIARVCESHHQKYMQASSGGGEALEESPRDRMIRIRKEGRSDG